MLNEVIEKFPPEVIEQLGYYVYRLIDPRNGETFYVGKGKANRVFDHVKENILEEEEENMKLKRIRDIKLAGFEVGHIIHRHGLDAKTAEHVEGALIDCFPGLSNISNGKGSGDYGVMNVVEIIKKYTAQIAEIRHKLILININRSALDKNILDATRFAWKVNINKAKKAEYICATYLGLIREVFIAKEWLKATPENFPEFPFASSDSGRYGFVGSIAPDDIQNVYKGKRLPDSMRKKGAANPIKYTY